MTRPTATTHWSPDQEKGYHLEKYRKSDYQKWDYITLDDFKNKSCANIFWYWWLWMLAIIAVAVYAADTFTAVNLLAFDKWSSQVKPQIPFTISKWIFAGCIMLSWALAAYEWQRAIRVIRRGNVAESYLDPLAVTLQSIRLGSGRGFRRFLVFSELTNSKKGADYVALFVYFDFKNAIRVILAEGPRQAINAISLYAVMKAELVPKLSQTDQNHDSNFDQFWVNVKILYQQNAEQAVIISTMTFTLVIWTFSALCLLTSTILYITFLWHYIPKEDGTLAKYCRRKIDGRLAKVVSKKVDEAIKAQEKQRQREEEKLAKKQGSFRPAGPSRAPTLPTLCGTEDGTSIDSHPGLSRQTTLASVAPSSLSGPSTYRQPTLPSINGDDDDASSIYKEPTLPSVSDLDKPSPLSRSGTQSSEMTFNTYNSDRPLLQGAAGMGRAPGPAGFTRTDSDLSSRPSFDRTMTGNSQSSNRSFPRSGPNGPPNRGFPPSSFDQPPDRPLPDFPRSNSGFPPRPPVGRSGTGSSGREEPFMPPPRTQSAQAQSNGQDRPGLARNFSLPKRDQSPAPSLTNAPYRSNSPAYEMQPRPPPAGTMPPNPYQNTKPTTSYRPYSPFNPASQGPPPPPQMHSRDASFDPAYQQPQPPRRINTNPPPEPFGRPEPPRRVGTAPLPTNPYARPAPYGGNQRSLTSQALPPNPQPRPYGYGNDNFL